MLRRSSFIIAPALLVAAACTPSVDGGAIETVRYEAPSKVPESVVQAVEAGQAVDVIVLLEDDSASATRVDLAQRKRSRDLLLVEQRDRYRQRADLVLGSLSPRTWQLKRRYEAIPYLHLTVESPEALAELAKSEHVKRVYEDQAFEATLAESLPLIGRSSLSPSYGGAGTTVAVLDTGVNYTYSAFGSCSAPGVGTGCKVAVAEEVATNDNALDDTGHGTNVAAIVRGVAPDADLAVYDVFRGGYAYSSDVLSAISRVLTLKQGGRNVVAINMSLGGGGSTTVCPTSVFATAIANAKAAGILTVVSSGNNAYTSKLSDPACVPDAVSVGAVYDANVGNGTDPIEYAACDEEPNRTTAPDQVACFTNRASFLKLLAPGAAISAAGSEYSGTSQAAPFVAGAIAVVRAARQSTTDTIDDTLSRIVDNGSRIEVDPVAGLTVPRLRLDAAVTDCIQRVSLSPATFPSTRAAGTLTVVADAGCSWTVASQAPSWITGINPGLGSGNGTVSFTVEAGTPGTSRTGFLEVNSRSVAVVQATDSSAPVGAVSINQGDYTNTRQVTLAFTAEDMTPPVVACVSNTTSCTSFNIAVPATAYAHELTAGNARKTVYVRFRDSAPTPNTTTTPVSDSITYDASAPVNGTMTADKSVSGQLTLNWSGFTDSPAGIASYRVVGSTSETPTDCSGTALATPTTMSYTHTGLTNGQIWYYRVCAVDRAGNTSTGATITSNAAPEDDPPANGAVVINWDPVAGQGAEFTRLLPVTLRITVPGDDSPTPTNPVYWCASQTAAACDPATAISGSPGDTFTSSLNLTATNGIRTVKVFFKDRWNNTTTCADCTTNGCPPCADTIKLDTVAPANGSISLTVPELYSGARVDVAWSGQTDAVAQVQSYSLRCTSADGDLTGSCMPGTAAPANCDTGSLLFQGMASSYAHTVTPGAKYYYRLCATDAAGNRNLGATASKTPAPEYSAPQGGAVVINGGALSTALTTPTTLTITPATDASYPLDVCISNTLACPAANWRLDAVVDAQVTSLTVSNWTLTSGSGVKRVYVRFRDNYGNTQADTDASGDAEAHSSSILLDQVKPTNGSIVSAVGSAPGNPAVGQVALTWRKSLDNTGGTGIASYRLVRDPNRAPADCSGTGQDQVVISRPATPIEPETYEETYTDNNAGAGLTLGAMYYYRLCWVDGVGNTSTGITASARPTPNLVPPDVDENALKINGGNQFTNSRSVTLSFAPLPTDADDIFICVSNTTTCTNPWENMATSWPSGIRTAAWTLAGTSGTQTVNVWVRDEYYNIPTNAQGNPLVLTDTIILDTVRPTNGRVTATPLVNNAIQVDWSSEPRFADTGGSSLASYLVAYKSGPTGTTAPTNCLPATGVTIVPVAMPATTHMVSGSRMTTYSFRVCAVDGATNQSTGATASATAVPEANPPTLGTPAISLTPAGTTVLDGSNNTWTRQAGVNLALSATDDTSAPANMDMCLSNSTTCTAWVDYATSKAWTMSGGTGLRTVYVKFRDEHLNTSAQASASIYLDTVAPANPLSTSLVLAPAATSIGLVWAAAADNVGGVSAPAPGGALPVTYRVVAGTSLPANCLGTAPARVVYEGPATTATDSGQNLPSTPPTVLADGTEYYYRVCTLDALGNMSSGTTKNAHPSPVGNLPPTGGISIAGVGGYGAGQVQLTLTATDPDGDTVAKVCVSNSPTCTSWVDFTGSSMTMNWTLPAPDALKTVYARFRDNYLNVSDQVSAQITRDATAPATPDLTATGQATVAPHRIVLSWAPVADGGSGGVTYSVRYQTASAPANCTTAGSLLASCTTSPCTHSGVSEGVEYYYRLCASDAVGNTSSDTANAHGAPELTAPTGTAVIVDADGDGWTNTTNVTLTLSATDSSGVKDVCMSNSTAACTSWVTWGTSKPWTLSGGDGLKTVYVYFRDIYNNASSAVTDTITLDATRPVNGTVTGTSPAAGQASLSWLGYTDAGSGVASYKVVGVAGTTAPTNCSGTALATTTEPTTTALIPDRSAGAWSFRVCAIDAVGNMSTGATTTVTVLP